VAEDTLNVALNYIRRNPRVGLMIDGLYSVKIGGEDASAILETRMIFHFNNVKPFFFLLNLQQRRCFVNIYYYATADIVYLCV